MIVLVLKTVLFFKIMGKSIMNIQSFLATCILCCLSPTFAFAQEDMAGSADYPDFPRISGSTIAGYSPSAFDEAPYLEGTHNDLTLRHATGEVTKILYLPPLNQSPTSALLNYETAFKELGEFELFYTCKRGRCDEDMGGDFIWHNENRFDSTLKAPSTYFFTYKQNRVKQVYLSGKITADTGAYIVSVYAAQAPKAKGDFKGGQTVVVLQIVKIESFEADLEVVAAEKLTPRLSNQDMSPYMVYFLRQIVMI